MLRLERQFARYARYATGNGSDSFWWPSQYLRARPLEGANRCIEIIEEMRKPGSLILQELESNVGNLTAILNPEFWNQYFIAYDKLVAFNPPYRELLTLAADFLPRRGNILDLGSGTGNFSLALALHSPDRKFTLVDQSRTGLNLAGAKFRARNHDGIETVERSLTAPESFPKADGAVLNNVLYSIPAPEQKLALMKRIGDSLSSGGRLFLNDPLPTTADGAFYGQCFTHIALGAASQKSPMTEFDLAVLTAANLQLTVSEGKSHQSLFYGNAQMKELIAACGLRLVSDRPTYVGVTHAYFIQKD